MTGDQGRPCTWCILAAFAFLAAVPALLTGRRIGAHAGHHGLTREERRAAGSLEQTTRRPAS